MADSEDMGTGKVSPAPGTCAVPGGCPWCCAARGSRFARSHPLPFSLPLSLPSRRRLHECEGQGDLAQLRRRGGQGEHAQPEGAAEGGGEQGQAGPRRTRVAAVVVVVRNGGGRTQGLDRRRRHRRRAGRARRRGRPVLPRQGGPRDVRHGYRPHDRPRSHVYPRLHETMRVLLLQPKVQHPQGDGDVRPHVQLLPEGVVGLAGHPVRHLQQHLDPRVVRVRPAQPHSPQNNGRHDRLVLWPRYGTVCPQLLSALNCPGLPSQLSALEK